MKTYQKLAVTVTAALVGLSLGAPALADDEYDNAVRQARGEYKAQQARCQQMKDTDRSACLKEARAGERRAIADATRKYGGPTKAKGAAPQSSSEIAGSDKMQKAPSHHDREKTSLPTAPAKGSSEVAGEDRKATSK